MSCNDDMPAVPARPIVKAECDRGMPARAASTLTAAMKETIIKSLIRNLRFASNPSKACSDWISAKRDVGV
jgi:hypothetical protein